MTYEVEMLAFGKGQIREVEIPDEDTVTPFGPADTDYILEKIFKYGQNDFQPRNLPSVSVDDVIRLNGERYKVDFYGFKRVSQE